LDDRPVFFRFEIFSAGVYGANFLFLSQIEEFTSKKDVFDREFWNVTVF
jgi:hypothetical protein